MDRAVAAAQAEAARRAIDAAVVQVRTPALICLRVIPFLEMLDVHGWPLSVEKTIFLIKKS